jgi:DNA-binding transcriptional LysR family regulator
VADRRMQVFHAVAKQLSFTRAAELLSMTQPAVTFQIKQLEEHFNTRLFDRGHGRISLTPAGEMVLQYADRILNLTSEMDVQVSEMSGDVGGPLLIGASTTIAEFMLPRILGEFKAMHPDVRPIMAVANSEAIELRIAERALDIGFIESPSTNPSLETEVCCDDELVVICSPDFPLAGLKEVTPQQLLAHPFISREEGSGTREFTRSYFRNAGLDPDRMEQVMEVGSPIAANGVLETGVGFSIASHVSVMRAERLGDLVVIPLKPRLTRPLTAVYAKEKFRSRLVKSFAQFSASRLSQIVGKPVARRAPAEAAAR